VKERLLNEGIFLVMLELKSARTTNETGTRSRSK